VEISIVRRSRFRIIVRRLAPTWWGMAGMALTASCATVTQEEPLSRSLGGGSSTESPLAPELGGSGGARAPRAPVPVVNVSGQPGITQGLGGSSGVSVIAADSGAAGSGNGSALDAGPALPSGTRLLSEDFEAFQAQAGGWSTSAGSVWELRPDPDGATNTVYVQTETVSSGANLATAGDRSWQDVSVEADVEILEFNGSSSSYMAGLCVRVQDASNFYMIGVRSNDGKVGLRRFADGGTNLVQSTFDTGTTGVKYRLRVDAVGSTISAYLGDTLMFSESDATHASGGIGLCTVRASAAFDNVQVSAL
jgi:hypothetical protein